ncbi:MAG: F0F1 ATP synthase subunit epsilon [Alphaproteobacteria bacterium]|nr:F0F1 ATP synthase subunit epsilon [Alphaproteobacteria bacterium]
MNNFTLYLQSSTQYEEINDIVSFIGEDSSGTFGIMANHGRMMTCLKFGLFWFRHENNTEEYLASPGGVLYFVENKLFINTRHYLRSKDYQNITTALEHELIQEEENIRGIKESLHRLDEEILKHLWELKRKKALFRLHDSRILDESRPGYLSCL